MSFIETRLDDCVAHGFEAIPMYKTLIVTMENGKEARNVEWTRAKRRYSALYQNFSPADFALLNDAFHACHGSGYSFRFKDWLDYKVTMGSIGTTPGNNQTPVQFTKVYTFGIQSTTRTIKKIVAGTTTVYQDNGSGVFVAKAGSIDTTTGLFTPTTNWTAGRALKATFEFDVPVRFASDEMPASYDDLEAINTNCELVEDFL